MRTLRGIRRRLKATREMEHITRALKMISAASLRKVQNRAESARPFARMISQVLIEMASLAGGPLHPLMAGREPGVIGLVVVSSDRGLCGRYNDDVLAESDRFMEEVGRDRVRVYPVGNVARKHYARLGARTFGGRLVRPRSSSFAYASELARELMDAYFAGVLDQCYLVYSRFHSIAEQKPRVYRLIPIVPPGPLRSRAGEAGPYESEQRADGDAAGVPSAVFIPSVDEIVDHLVPRYVEVEVFRALLEAEASERAARMMAMSEATDNAAREIKRLSEEFHRRRQAMITAELAEITAAAKLTSAATDRNRTTGNGHRQPAERGMAHA